MASVSTKHEQRLVLHGVSWKSYLKLLDAFSEQRLRHSYDGWSLEMMSPGEPHERIKHLIGVLVQMLCLELRMPVRGVGSWTLHKTGVAKGLEPDECFYIANATSVSGSAQHDLDRQPPPDLAIEVDYSRSSISRLKIYAELGVREVWRYRKGKLKFHGLVEGKYQIVPTSVAFPWLGPADLDRFVGHGDVPDETQWIIKFVDWVRAQPWYQRDRGGNR